MSHHLSKTAFYSRLRKISKTAPHFPISHFVHIIKLRKESVFEQVSRNKFSKFQSSLCGIAYMYCTKYQAMTRNHCCLIIKAKSSLKLTTGTVLQNLVQNVFIPRKPVSIPDNLSQFGWTFKPFKFIQIFFALILSVARSRIYQSHFAGAFEIGSVVWKIQIATRCKNCWTSLQVLIRRNSIIECAIQFRTEALSGKLTRPARKSSNNVWT